MCTYVYVYVYEVSGLLTRLRCRCRATDYRIGPTVGVRYRLTGSTGLYAVRAGARVR